MNVLHIAFAYAKRRPLATGFNVALLAVGIATITLVILAVEVVIYLPSAGNFRQSWLNDRLRIGIVAAPEEVEQAVRELTERFGNRIVSHCIRVPAYGVDVMEVFDPAVNKWEGISHVARMHGVEAHEIVAIGDDVNDLPMLKHAGLSVAMGNAKPEVKAIAKTVIGRNDEDGLAIFLEELVANHLVVPAPQ